MEQVQVVAALVDQLTTFHWCSCGGSGDGNVFTRRRYRDRAQGSVSFTADKSGRIKLCSCGTDGKTG